MVGSQVFFPKFWEYKYFSQYSGNIKNMKSIFAERLLALRLEKGIGQIQLAKELGVGKSIISCWELGSSEPTLSKLIVIAQYFGVTIDYLAGLEN
mgnify:CR=1 FL=1